MNLTWDEAKRKANLRKHGLDFRDTPEMFEGPMVIDLDDSTEHGEERLIGFGYIKGRVVKIVFLEPNPNLIRVVSLRKATKNE
ncbi:MAG: BrnT family toxin [Thermodesulfobacteriota bacterium]